MRRADEEATTEAAAEGQDFGRLALVGGVGALVIALVTALDFVTGPELRTEIFFLLPIGACGWIGGRWAGLAVGLAGALGCLTTEIFEHEHSQAAFYVWDALTHALVFLAAGLGAGLLRESQETVRQLERFDRRTGAATMLTLKENIELEVRRASRSQRPFSLAYFSLTGFRSPVAKAKGISELAITRQVVELLMSLIRETDLVGAISDEELVLLFPETDADAAQTFLPTVRYAVLEAASVGDLPVSLDMGCLTVLPTTRNPDELVARVDHLLGMVKLSCDEGVLFRTCTL